MEAQVESRTGEVTAASALLTIGAIIVAGKVVSDQIKGIIGRVSVEARELLEEIDGDINRTIANLERTYQDNLNATLNSLDAFTRNQLLQLEQTFTRLNEEIQSTIDFASQRFIETVRATRLEVQLAAVELERSLKNVIVIGGETIAYVVDRTINNIILVASIILFGIGLIFFTGYLFKQGLPGGFTSFLVLFFMLLFLAVFGVLAFVPKFRGMAMSYTGVGLKGRLEDFEDQPRILAITPQPVTVTATAELKIWGVSLLPENKVLEIKVGTRKFPPKAKSQEQIVIGLVGFASPSGSYDLVLLYNGEEGPRAVAEIKQPAPPPQPSDLRIRTTSFVVNPNPPEEDRVCTFSFEIQNIGQGPAASFNVKFEPEAGTSAFQTFAVSGLDSGDTRAFTATHTYPRSGQIQAVVVVDPEGRVSEQNEANNVATLSFNVQPYQRQLIVQKSKKVYEGDFDVDTQIDVINGDRIKVTASGLIWAGVWLTGDNGPEGWSNDPAPTNEGYPLPGAPKFALLSKLDGDYTLVSRSFDEVVHRTGRLYLRINDNVPNNGSKFEANKYFDCQVSLYR